MVRKRQHCSALNNFQSIISPATRINRRGRAKGGLILLNNKEHMSIDQILHKDDHCIVCMYGLSYSSLKSIVVLLYYPPDLKSKCILECFEKLEEVLCPFDDQLIVFMGDFNAWIGNNSCSAYTYKNNLSDDRNSMDNCVNIRGKQLPDFCGNNQLSVLNGRTTSDSEGELTFIETTGASIIDYILVNNIAVDYVNDMNVCQSIHSAHSALQLTLNLNGNNFGRSGIVAKPKIVFNEANKIEFQSHFKNNLVKFCSVCLMIISKIACLSLHWKVRWLKNRRLNQSTSLGLIENIHQSLRVLKNALKRAEANKWELTAGENYLTIKRENRNLTKKNFMHIGKDTSRN